MRQDLEASLLIVQDGVEVGSLLGIDFEGFSDDGFGSIMFSHFAEAEDHRSKNMGVGFATFNQ